MNSMHNESYGAGGENRQPKFRVGAATVLIGGLATGALIAGTLTAFCSKPAPDERPDWFGNRPEDPDEVS